MNRESDPPAPPLPRRAAPPSSLAPLAPSVAHDAAETLAVLGPVARSSVVDAVADRLRGEILAGRLPSGSRLPSERELSLALGVNRLTLRAALARLEALGLVATRHGAGTLVTSWRERAGLDSLAALIGSLKPEDPAWYELAVSLLELRRILATEAVALAAERHTPEQLAEIARLAGEQKGRTADPIEYARGELAVERAIIRATGNVALELALNMFARFPDEQPEVVAALYDQREHAHLFYDLVLDLLRSRDANRAREQMRLTFEMIDADWMARHRPPGVKVPPAPAISIASSIPRSVSKPASPGAPKAPGKPTAPPAKAKAPRSAGPTEPTRTKTTRRTKR